MLIILYSILIEVHGILNIVYSILIIAYRPKFDKRYID